MGPVELDGVEVGAGAPGPEGTVEGPRAAPCATGEVPTVVPGEVEREGDELLDGEVGVIDDVEVVPGNRQQQQLPSPSGGLGSIEVGSVELDGAEVGSGTPRSDGEKVIVQ